MLFAKYVSLIAGLWLAWVLIDLLLGLLVFPRTIEGVWYIGLGGTLGCLACGVIIGVLKALFDRKIAHALENLGAANA